MTIQDRDRRMMEEGRAEGEILGTIRIYHDELELAPAQITEKLMSRFYLERSDAERYVDEALNSSSASESTVTRA